MKLSEQLNSYKRFLPWLMFVLAAALVFFLVFPQYKLWKVRSKESAATAKELLSKKETLAILQSVDKEKIRRLERLMPETPQEKEILVQLESLASKSGVILRTVSLQTKKDEGRVLIRETLQGSYDNLKLYLSNLETNLRLLDVESLNLSYDEKNSLYSLDISAFAFFLGKTDINPSVNINLSP